MPTIQKIARSLSDFINIVTALSDDWEGPWFRGQDHASDQLKPRRYRYQSVDEDDIRSEFKRRIPQLVLGAQPGSEWERYFLMQHYGIPTRLLDWSEGSLIALHFALISNQSRNDSAVWVLDPFWLNAQVAERSRLFATDIQRLAEILPEAGDPNDEKLLHGYLGNPFPSKPTKLPEFPIALQPPHIDRRITAQLSSFTIHGRDPLGLEHLAEANRRPRLAKITIPRKSTRRMLEQLLDSGITEATVYPDLQGLALELTRLFSRGKYSRAARPHHH